MRAVLLWLLLASGAPAQVYSASTNVTTDILGTPETTVVDTWPSTAGYNDHPLVFTPPAGMRVRILRLAVNFVAAPSIFKAVPSGTGAEVMWSALTTSVQNSPFVMPAAVGCLAWVQGLLTSHLDTLTKDTDRDVKAAGLLGPDNTLVIRLAVALNTTGLLIHEELTVNMEYEFTKEQN